MKSKDDETDEQTIDSVDSLSCFLQSLQADASPSVIMALQSQIQVLRYVQSPTMMLMAVDNIMLCLHKALKSAEDETTKENLKETFASLLQSFIFAIEAVSQVTKSPTLHDYESVRNIKRALQSELKNFDKQIEDIDTEIIRLETELSKTSLFQISRKGELQRAITAYQTERTRINQAAMEYRNKLTVVSDIIDPINENIEKYTNNLYRIVEKYKYVV